MDSLAQAIARSPELFPLRLDPATDQVALVRLVEADYAQASFLDERILADASTPRRMVPWQSLAEAAVGLPTESASYIFHIGHVGSTLLSRLLGQHPRVFAIREPAILRALAQMAPGPTSRIWSETEFDRRLATVLKLLSRTFRPEQRAVVKATSFVSELAPQILARLSTPRAVFMFVPVQSYLATILGAPNSPAEARALAQSRLARLHGRIGEQRWKVSELSLGEIVAMSWASEVGALATAAAAAGDRVLWVDFDHFLAAPAPVLSSVFNHLGIEAAPDEIAALVARPELGRYSKAPEHAYDANLRRMVLDQARREHAVAISEGLDWLQRAAAEFKAIPKHVDNA